MGYSGGAIPSTWANALASEYAPELNLVGVAAGGITADPLANLPALDGTAFFGVVIGASVGIDRAYPEVDLNSLLNEKGRALAASNGMDTMGCSGQALSAPFGHVSDYFDFPTPMALAALPRIQRVYSRLNLVTRPRPRAPSYFFNSVNDQVTIIEPVDRLVAANCSKGAVIEYVRSPAGEHLVGAAAYLEPALAYLQDRFAGKPAPDTCPIRPSDATAPIGGADPPHGRGPGRLGMRLTVAPRRVRAGRRRVHFRVRSSAAGCRRGVTIAFAGRRVRTGRRGRAHLRVRLTSGRINAVATKPGCRRSVSKLTVS